MKMLVALYDRATEAYAPVMTVHTRAEAIRSFRQAVNDKTTPMHNNPTDYELYQVGTYDDQTGIVQQKHEMIARAEDHKE
jgi:hypothetical protein